LDEDDQASGKTARKSEQVKTPYSTMIPRTNQLAPEYRDKLRVERQKLIRDAAPLPDLLFHYTTAEACFSILNSKPSKGKPSLWASSSF
jgi:hypothetical protein